MPKIGTFSTRKKHLLAHMPWSVWESAMNHAFVAQIEPAEWVEKMIILGGKQPLSIWRRDYKYVPLRCRQGAVKALRLGPEAKATLRMAVDKMGDSVSRAVQILYRTGVTVYAARRIREMMERNASGDGGDNK